MTAPQLLSTREAGERMNVRAITVWRWIKSGRLPAINIASPGGRVRLRISEDDLRAFIEEHRLDVTP